MSLQPPKTKDYIKRVANTCISGTTLRKMPGVKGNIDIARKVLSELDLKKLKTYNFNRIIDEWTLKINACFNNKNWGASRKTINLFIRDCIYDYHLRNIYNLEKIEKLAELPLDSKSMKWIIENTHKKNNLKLIPVSRIDESNSRDFQHHALFISRRLNVARVHIDLLAWKR